jgi:lysozyme
MATANCIIDLSHNNADVDLDAIRNDGIFGIFHKATQGLHFIDPTYTPRRAAAAAAGLNWGAYHFGTGADGSAQADFFLANATPGPGDLLALDFEMNNQGPSMTLDEARDFVSRIKDVHGSWPGLYGGSYLKEQLGGTADPVLSNCWLWLAQYGPDTILPPGWNSWTLWQYTDGHVGPEPHQVAGVQQCDRDMFQGSPDDLAAFWQ